MQSGFQLAHRQAEAYELLSGQFMRGSARIIVESMDVQPGDAFLDLACGTGLIARFAWPAVAPTGRVVGIDLNPSMLAVAELQSAGTQIEWIQSSAESLEFADDSFSHVACQQGLQFFPDALAAMREVHRVLRPGGSFVATIWATPGHNPYIETQLALLSELNEAASTSARAAIPGEADLLLTSLAKDAGFADIEVSLLEHTTEIADLHAFFRDQTASTPWATVLSSLSSSEQSRLADAFVERLAPYASSSGSHVLPFASHKLVARKH